jgi:hypothetical protein
MMIDYIKYSVTTAQLDPMATLAAATLQFQDPAVLCAELIRQVNMDGARVRTMEQNCRRWKRQNNAMNNFTKEYSMNNPAPGTRQVPQVDLWPAPCSQHRGSSATRLSVRLHSP